MTNPIQTVLAAQAAAYQEVARARRDAERALDAARAAAQRLLERNEARSLRAIRDYEARGAAQTATEIATLNAAARHDLESFARSVESQLDTVVQQAFTGIWSK